MLSSNLESPPSVAEIEGGKNGCSVAEIEQHDNIRDLYTENEEYLSSSNLFSESWDADIGYIIFLSTKKSHR